MKNKLFFCLIFIMLAIPTVQAVTVINFTSNSSWEVPVGVTNITVEAWGAGGGGGGGSTATNGLGGGGGGGGQYAKATINVTAGQIFNIIIGAAGDGGAKGVSGTAGGDTYFFNQTKNYTRAKGGTFGITYTSGAGGGLGSTTGAIGDVFYAGGNGANGGTGSGAGGGGAGSTGAGGNATTQTGGLGTSELGGDGGIGRIGNNLAGGDGLIYGGAGGGGTGKTGVGAAGAQGIIRITYTPASTCIYGGTGNWDLKCSDDCIFDSTQTINNENNITITGTGTLTFNNNGKWRFTGVNQYITIASGCTLNINSGGGWNY